MNTTQHAAAKMAAMIGRDIPELVKTGDLPNMRRAMDVGTLYHTNSV